MPNSRQFLPPARDAVGRSLAATALSLCLAAFSTQPALARDYYPRTLYQIGLPGRPILSQVTPEGWVNNGWTEFPYYTGTEMKPLDDIELTPSADGRPLVHGSAERDGIRYDLEYFSAPLAEGVLVPPQVDVVRVAMRNHGAKDQRLRFWAGIRYAADPGRSHFPEAFMHWGWRYEFRRNVVAKDGLVVAVFPLGYAERFGWPGHIYDGRFGLNPRFTRLDKPCALVRYDFLLHPGQDTSLVFYYPGEAGPDSYGPLLNSTPLSDYRRRFDTYWDGVLSALPDLRLGDHELSSFVRRNVVLSLLQTGFWNDLVHPYPNKNLHPFLEGLELSERVRAWHRMGLKSWEEGAYRSLHSLQKPEILVHAGREGRVGTAGVIDLISERALDQRDLQAAHLDTLAWRADTVALWGALPGSRRSGALECAVGASALRTYSELLAAAGMAAEARTRAAQADSLWETSRVKFLDLGEAGLLGLQGETLRWLAESRPLTPGLQAMLRPASSWHISEGLVTAPSDTAMLWWSLARLQSRPEGDPASSQDLLAVIAHATGQGGLPAGLHVSARDFGDMMPPEAGLGSRVVENLLDRVVVDSANWLLLGRGMPPPQPGDSVSVGPLDTRFGPVHVQAEFIPGGAHWTWTSSGKAGIKVRIYVPAGCTVRGGGGKFVETDLSAGRADLSWDGRVSGLTLSEWRSRLEPRNPAPAATHARTHRRR